MKAETITLGLFVLGLALCIISGTPVLFALLFGMACFFLYSLKKGFSFGAACSLFLEGMSRVKNILIIFVLIGCLTASWRISGTIPFILYHAMGLIHPRYFVLCTFLLCCAMSFLTGTSFGTVSTVGVICMLISNTAGLPPLLTGGAIMSGIFFGDRCSPMSSSAQLVCSLTDTEIYENIKRMMRSGFIPFLLCVFLYLFLADGANASPDPSMVSLFAEHFSLHWATGLPALLILVLALLKVDVKYAMAVSILTASLIALLLQKVPFAELLLTLLTGYHAKEGSELARLLNGGGIRSMVSVGFLVLISSSYSGVFSHTPILSGIKELLKKAARFLTPFGAAILAAILSCGVGCNQTLGTILTSQICDGLYEKKEDLALTLENTAILIAALIPWGIAGSVPAAALGVSLRCLFYSFYLYLVPLCNLLAAIRQKASQSPNRS